MADRRTPNLLRRILVSVSHGLFTCLLLVLYLNSGYVSEEEEKGLEFFAFSYFQHKPDSISERMVLVNTAKDLALADDPPGKTDITDRGLLAGLMQKISQLKRQPQLIICDINFDKPSAQDSTLQEAVSRLPQLFIPYEVVNNQKIASLMHVPENRQGFAIYHSHAEKMIKMPLMLNNGAAALKSLPVAVDEMLNNRSYSRNHYITRCNGRAVLNSIIPGFYVRSHELLYNQDLEEIQQQGMPGFDLHDLAVLTPTDLEPILAGKWILIGNFEKDQHLTAIGKMPGSFILLNTCISLLKNQQFISFGWILLILLSFSALSYLIFYKEFPHFRMQLPGIWNYLLHSFLAKFFSIFGVVLVISLLSILWFNIHVNILILSLYYALLTDIFKYRKQTHAT